MDTQNLNSQMGSGPMSSQTQPAKKGLFIAFVLIVVALLGFWVWRNYSSIVVPEEVKTGVDEDTTSAIEQELNANQVANPDQEMQAIESDLNSL